MVVLKLICDVTRLWRNLDAPREFSAYATARKCRVKPSTPKYLADNESGDIYLPSLDVLLYIVLHDKKVA